MLIPYVSPQEFANAPTGLNLQTLVPTGTSADNSAELLRVLQRASGWIDNECNMQLRATQNTETKRVWVSRDGSVGIFPNFAPIQQLLSVGYRIYPQQSWVNVDLTTIEVLPNHFSWYGVLSASSQVSVQYTYVNGWAVSSLSSAVSAGATTLPLTNTVGIHSGTILTLYDGINTEQVAVSAVAGNNVTVSTPLLYGHVAGVHVSELPDNIRQACILVASSFIKERRSGGIVMQGQLGQLKQDTGSSDTNELEQATHILRSYKRVI